MERAESLLEEIKAVAAQLSAAERLAMIRALVDPMPANKEKEADDLPETDTSLLAEQEAWYSRPKADRMRYTGNYVAVVDGDVVDQDPDQRALVLRMRARSHSALIVLADWDAPPTLMIPNIRRHS